MAKSEQQDFFLAPGAQEKAATEEREALLNSYRSGKHGDIQRVILERLAFNGPLTDEELARWVNWNLAPKGAPLRHSSIVSSRNWLVGMELVKDSGKTRRSKTSGRTAKVWELVKDEPVEGGAQ